MTTYVNKWEHRYLLTTHKSILNKSFPRRRESSPFATVLWILNQACPREGGDLG